MDTLILFLYQNLFIILVLACLLILVKFIGGLMYFKGNVVDSITKFFWFYSASNIGMTESHRTRMLKRMNNVMNIIIYLLVFLYFTIYYVHPDIDLQ